ncbi:MAG: hypothetical protein AAF636_11460 [Pseudomonadota bacterium]
MTFRYIDAMEHFWAVYFSQGGLTERDFLVYSYLVHTCNSLRGKNPFQCETARASLVLKFVDKKTGKPQPEQFARSQRRLKKAGLIDWVKGRKGVAPSYTLIMPESRAGSVSNTVSNTTENKPISGKKTSESVSDSVTLQGRDRKIEGGSASPPTNLIEFAEKHEQWGQLDPDCLREIYEKFMAHYAAKPHMINQARWLQWLKDERKKNLRWKPKELPLVELPSEPKGWQVWLRNDLANAEMAKTMTSYCWDEFYTMWPETSARIMDAMREGKCDENCE